ncbi:MAG: antitoxin [Ruminococcus sp.]|nr:antitoxin [Ruminococcus sp.]
MAKTKYEGSKNAIKKYIAEKTDDIRLRVPKGTKDRWKSYAESKGISLTKFVVQAVEKTMENGD